MPLGPGKYDELLTYALKESKAAGGILLLFEAIGGNRFCVQVHSFVCKCIVRFCWLLCRPCCAKSQTRSKTTHAGTRIIK